MEKSTTIGRIRVNRRNSASVQRNEPRSPARQALLLAAQARRNAKRHRLLSGGVQHSPKASIRATITVSSSISKKSPRSTSPTRLTSSYACYEQPTRLSNLILTLMCDFSCILLLNRVRLFSGLPIVWTLIGPSLLLFSRAAFAPPPLAPLPPRSMRSFHLCLSLTSSVMAL